MAHDVTKNDMHRIMRVINYLWPEIDSCSYLAQEMESAAMLGLAEAAIKFSPHRLKSTTWELYSQQIAIYRVVDMFRAEMDHPGGITGAGKRGKEEIPFEIDRPLADDGVHNLDPCEMADHATEPDLVECIAQKEFIETLLECFRVLALEPAYTATMWVMYLSGYDQSYIADYLNDQPNNAHRTHDKITNWHISRLMTQQRPLVIKYMVEHYYNRYPYPE